MIDEKKIAAALETGFKALDISEEAAAVERATENYRTTVEAAERARKDAEAASTRLGEIRQRATRGIDMDAAADAYLAGRTPESAEATEAAAKAEADALRAAANGLNRRINAASAEKDSARSTAERKLATAAEHVCELLNTEAARIMSEAEALRAVARVIASATRSGPAATVARGLKEALDGWRVESRRSVELTQETPAWLTSVLEPFRDMIIAGRGTILQHVTPPREPRPEPEPRPEEAPYEPGQGGSAALTGGWGVRGNQVAGIAVTKI